MESARMRLFNTPMDMSKPLWKISVVFNGQADAQKHLFVFRASHGMADGVRLSEVIGAMSTFKDGKRAEVEVFKKMTANKSSRGFNPLKFGIA